MRRLSRALAAAAITITLAGCVGAGPWTVVEHADSGHVLLLETGDDGVYPTAQVSGELVLIGDTCFGLAEEFGAVTVGFPAGTTILDDGMGLTIPHKGEVRLGDRIEGGGGTLSADELGLDAKLPAACNPTLLSHLNPFGH